MIHNARDVCRAQAAVRALAVCSVPGCMTPAEPGRGACHAHCRRKGHAWHKASVAARSVSGRCVLCGGPATVAHHRVPVSLGGPELPPQARIDAVCADCHPRAERAAVRAALHHRFPGYR
jgi:hypothetical protein